jgi:hypothetical protein
MLTARDLIRHSLRVLRLDREASISTVTGRVGKGNVRNCRGRAWGAILGSTLETGILRHKKSRWPREERLCRKEGLSMVLSLYLRSTLGIIFFPSPDKFGGAFEEPFLPFEDRTRPMRR